MKISKRDEALLKWLGLFVALYLIWTFLFIPMDKKNDVNRQTLVGLRIQEVTTKKTLPLRDSIATEKLSVQTNIESQFLKFFDDSTPAQMESFFVPFLSQFNVRFRFFEVSPTTVVIPKTTLSVKEQVTYKIKTLIDKYKTIVNPVIVLPVTQSDLLKTKITYILAMTFSDFLRMSDAIKNLDNSVIITTANYDFADLTAEVTFDIYSMEKISFQP